jgi:hypothetical protein
MAEEAPVMADEAPAVLVEEAPVMAEEALAVMVEEAPAVLVEEALVMAEEAPAVREAQPSIIRSIVGVMLVGPSGRGKNHADQERYNPPHHCAAIHHSLRGS